MKTGIDTSHHQGIIDWDKVKTDFVFQKCTENTDFVDATYVHNKSDCITKGIPFGSYHYAGGQDPIKEADWYLKNAGDEQLVLDWEINHTDPVGWCKKFIGRIKENNRDCMLYTGDARANAYDWPKEWTYWIARYGINDGTVSREPNFKNWKIHQYTSRGRLDGIKGFVDLNRMKEIIDTNMPFTPGKFTILSQRDPRWGFKPIGKSNLLVKDYGCTLTGVSMASSWFNCFQNPGYMSQNLRYTDGGLIIWQSISEKTCFDFEWRFYGCSHNLIREALKNDRKICLLQVYNRHWVVAMRNVFTGYRTADPWTGTSKYYANNSISGGTILKI